MSVRGLVDELRQALAGDRVRDGSTELSLYRHDASHMEGAAVAVCFPFSTEEVKACVDLTNLHGVPFVARGSGTGLAGGAVPPEGGVVIATTKMNRILSVDPAARRAWVEPGVLNLDLSRAVAEHGLHFAPDPSSQQTCSIGGNVANNSGGPHCLAEGVTNAHILAIEVVLPDGTIAVLGGEDPEPAGFDLRGVFVGSEGMLGVATKICVRLTPDPPAICTMLMDFASVEAGASTVSAVIAAGIVPAAMEMMDQLCLQAVEAYIGAGLPVDAATALLVEVGRATQRRRSGHGDDHAVSPPSTGCATCASPPTRSSGRCCGRAASRRSGRLPGSSPTTTSTTPWCRAPSCRRCWRRSTRSRRATTCWCSTCSTPATATCTRCSSTTVARPGVMERVQAAGEEIVRASVDAGGVLSGEHGIGLEKRDLMPLMFSPVDLAAQAALRDAFDERGLANPGKVLPSPAGCGDLRVAAAVAEGAWI